MTVHTQTGDIWTFEQRAKVTSGLSWSLYVQLNPAMPGRRKSERRLASRPWLGDERMHLLVAEDEGRITGTATLVVVPNLTHNGQPWGPAREHGCGRGRGAGRAVGCAIIEECVRRAWEAGYHKVQLQSANEREGAHRFYQEIGFVASSVGFRLYRG